MTIEQLNQAIDSKRKGTYMSICYKTNGKDDTYKIVKSVIRIVNYV